MAYSIDEFADILKKKYPVYADRDNKTLVDAWLKKYPVYADRVSLEDAPRPKLAEAPKIEQLGGAFEVGRGSTGTIANAPLSEPAIEQAKKAATPSEKVSPSLSPAPQKSMVTRAIDALQRVLEPSTAAQTAKAQIRLEAQKSGLSVPDYMDKVYPTGHGQRQLESLGPAFLQGAVSTPEGMANAAAWLTGSQTMKDFATRMSAYADEFEPTTDDFSTKVASGAGSMATFFIPGIGVARGAARLTSVSAKAAEHFAIGANTVMEAAVEAGSVWRQVMDETGDKAKADAAATKTFAANGILIPLTDKLGGLFGKGAGAREIAKTATLEGSQEAGQQAISDTAQGKPIDKRAMLESGAVGAIVGGGAKLSTRIGDALTPQQPVPTQDNGLVAGPDGTLQERGAGPMALPPMEGPAAAQDAQQIIQQEVPTNGLQEARQTPQVAEIEAIQSPGESAPATGSQSTVPTLNPDLFEVETTSEGAVYAKPKTNVSRNERLRNLLTAYPTFTGEDIQGSNVTELKQNVQSFLNDWSGHEKPSPAFNGAIVKAGEHALRHSMENRRSDADIMRRLKLFKKARVVLENVPYVENIRSESEGGKTFTLVGGFSDGQAVRVVVQEMQRGDKHFYSVFDVQDAKIKPSTSGTEGISTDSISEPIPENNPPAVGGTSSASKIQTSPEMRPGEGKASAPGFREQPIQTEQAVKDSVNPRLLGLQEMVLLSKDLTGKYPEIVAKIRGRLGTLGQMRTIPGVDVRIKMLGELSADPEQARAVLAHEIGHVVDALPEKNLSRGNILGRLKSLHKFLGSTISALPDNPAEILTPGERNVLRRRAATVARKTGQDAKEVYRTMLSDTLRQKGLISKQEVMDELKKVSQWWEPFNENFSDSYTKYRYSSSELYADAFSVLCNNPQQLAIRAPKFYAAFFANMERKPDVKQAWMESQARIEAGTTIDEAEKRLLSGFVEGNIKHGIKDNAMRKEDSAEVKRRKIAANIYDRNKLMLDLVSATPGIKLEDNPYQKWQDFLYRAGQSDAFMRDVSNSLSHYFTDGKINMTDYGLYAFYMRVAYGDRSQFFNPQGFTQSTAMSALAKMRTRLGQEPFLRLKEISEKYHTLRNEYVIDLAEQAGLFDTETITRMRENKLYYRFDVYKHLESKFGHGISAKVFQQIGTFSEISHPFYSDILQNIAVINSAKYNIAMRSMVDFLKEYHPDMVQKAKRGHGGKFQETHVPDKSLVVFTRDGQAEGWYVPEGTAQAFEQNNLASDTLTQILRGMSAPMRALYTGLRPGFALFNVIRDAKRNAQNIKGMANWFDYLSGAFGLNMPMKAMYLWAKELPAAYGDTIGVSQDELAKEMKKAGAVWTSREYGWRDAQEGGFEKLLATWKVDPQKFNLNIEQPLQGFLSHLDWLANGVRWWRNSLSAADLASKRAAYRKLSEDPTLTKAQVTHLTRTQAGTPDILTGGNWTPMTNNLFLYSNVMFQGWRGDINAFKRDKFGWGTRVFTFSVWPKILMFAAVAGIAGTDWKKFFEEIPEYDKTNYLILPLGWSASGKPAYMRIPIDETQRLISGTLWKSLNADKPRQIQNLADYMAGQAPTLTPVLGTAVDLMMYATGNVPRDFFHGTPKINEQMFRAGGLRSHKEMLKAISNDLGGTIIYRFKAERAEGIKSELEQTLGYPILSDTVGRFVRISNQGIVDNARAIRSEAMSETANKYLTEREAVMKHFNSYTEQGETPEGYDIGELWGDLYREGITTKKWNAFHKYYTRMTVGKRTDNAYLDILARSNTNAEKISLLNYWRQNMTQAEYDDLKQEAFQEGTISNKVYYEAP